jgi:pyrroline-5-carboxylate reductase
LTIKLGIIGGGVMAEALLSRLVGNGLYAPETVIVSEPQGQRRDWLGQQYGLQITENNRLPLAATEAVFLAIKPQHLPDVVEGLGGAVPQPQTLMLSILAGVSLRQLEEAFPNLPMIRAMPNTPATVGAGMTAIALGQWVQPNHRELALRLFQAVGEVVEVPETLMDAVTALSGSGPGYIAVLIEALTDGGVAVGLPRSTASKLALQTVRGTAQLLQSTGMHPAELKDRVTSPAGTTITGIASLEQAGFRSAIIEAVQAACRRSQELGE